MIYLFGKMVTAEEKAFFSTVLARKSDRMAQAKYFKAVYNTAKREGVSLIQANDIVELKTAQANSLNQKSHHDSYFVDSTGQISESFRDIFSNHIFKRKVSEDELNKITHGEIINPAKPKESFFSEAKKSIKKAWGFIKEAFSIY